MRTAIMGVVVILLLASGSASANLISSGGFDTGDFTGWTLSGAGVSAGVPDPTYVGVIADHTPHSPHYNAYFADPFGLTYLLQTFTTIPGQAYKASFWAAQQLGNQGSPSNEFQFFWNGTLLLDQVNAPVAPWTHLEGVLIATGPSTEVKFGFQNGPGWFSLDDLSVEPVPEPNTMILCGAALAFLVMRARRAGNAA